MQRAVAFWSSIKESERFAAQFDLVADHYNRQRAVEADPDDTPIRQLAVPTRHVDGTDNIRSRRTDIRWLKDIPRQYAPSRAPEPGPGRVKKMTPRVRARVGSPGSPELASARWRR